MRFASSPAWGPAISSSPAPPLALEPVAPAPSAPLFAMPCPPASGFDGLLEQALSAQAPTSSNTTITRCMDNFSDIPLPPPSPSRMLGRSGAERPPRRLLDLSLGSLQPQSRQAVGSDHRQRAATAFALRINECSAVRGETRRFIEMPARQHPHGAAREI